MSRVLRTVPWLTVLGCLLFGRPAPAADEHHKAPPKVYTASIEEGGEVKERKFDLAKPGDRQALDELLAKGEVEELRVDKEPDLLGLKWDLGLWTLVVFGMLCLILSKVAWGPMLEGLRKREQSIAGALDDARKARAEADQMRQQFQSDMAKAKDNVNAMIEEGRRNAQRVAEEETAKARAVMQEERERIHRELQLAKDQALQELWSQTAELATVISSNAIHRQMSVDDHRRLVDEALVELNKHGNDWKRQQLN